MSESKDTIPENWPPEIKDILNTLPLECRANIIDFINLSYQAGFFDGEGSIIRPKGVVTPRINSQEIECLQLYRIRHGGSIALMAEAGTPVYAIVDGERILHTKYNRDTYYWIMVGRRSGPGTRSYVDKTNFLLSILPLQHNRSKIRDTIRGLLDLKWSSRERWEHLIPEVIEAPYDILSHDEMTIKKMLESGGVDVREEFK